MPASDERQADDDYGEHNYNFSFHNFLHTKIYTRKILEQFFYKELLRSCFFACFPFSRYMSSLL